MATTASTPDWLALHGGELKPAPDRVTHLVLLSGTPQYKLTPTPAGGQFGCAVVASVNGKRLDQDGKYPTADAALHGGLEVLRAKLGW